MSLDTRHLEAVIFDYGNTLIEFSRRQIDMCDTALMECLEQRIGPVDRDQVRAIRDADRMAVFGDGFRERPLPEVCTGLLEQLGCVPVDAALIDELCRVRRDAFVDVVRLSDDVPAILEALGQRYRLAMISNYPDAESILCSLDKIGLRARFDPIVISADLGRVKPHALLFRTCLEAMGLQPGQAVFIGDNWLADIQGAKRIGMQAVWTRQYDRAEPIEPQPGDLQPDLTVSNLQELKQFLLATH